jgi:hypothetical protein
MQFHIFLKLHIVSRLYDIAYTKFSFNQNIRKICYTIKSCRGLFIIIKVATLTN